MKYKLNDIIKYVKHENECFGKISEIKIRLNLENIEYYTYVIYFPNGSTKWEHVDESDIECKLVEVKT